MNPYTPMTMNAGPSNGPLLSDDRAGVMYSTPRNQGVRVLSTERTSDTVDSGTERSLLQQSSSAHAGGQSSQLVDQVFQELEPPKLSPKTADANKGSPFGITVDVNSDPFNMGIGMVIVINAVIIGLETDMPPCTFFTVMEHLFNTIFLTEMLLRLSHMKLEYFRVAWNLFDCSLVMTGTLDLWILPAVTGGQNSGGIASLMRLLRVLRILRVIRIFRMFRELTLIAQAFMDAFSSVCWIGTLVLILDYICAVFLTRTLGHKAQQWSEEYVEDIDKWFGSIGRSMYTLFMIMTLAEWDMICKVTMEEYPGVVIFFVLYILVASYTMVSLITGVISESLITAQSEDETNKIRAIEKGRIELKDQLQKVFEAMDNDNSGTVSKEEIQEVILYNPYVSAKLESLDINASLEELMELFDAILNTKHAAEHAKESDHSQHGTPVTTEITPHDPSKDSDIPIDQFVSALSSIRGTASSKESFLMRQDIKAIMYRQEEMANRQEEMANRQVEMFRMMENLMESKDQG